MFWIKRIFSQIHRYVLWLMISIVFWAWIFTVITDTVAAKKIILYAHVPSIADRELTIELEKDLPEGIKMIQVHPFTYAMFNTTELGMSDLYIIPESEMTDMIATLCTIPETEAGEDAFFSDGTAYGLMIYNAETQKGCASGYLQFRSSLQPDENYYICFGLSSRHLGEWNGSKDDAAVVLAKQILSMP